MEQCTSSKANSHSSSQKFPPFMEPEDSLPCSQEPANGLNPESGAVNPHLPNLLP